MKKNCYLRAVLSYCVDVKSVVNCEQYKITFVSVISEHSNIFLWCCEHFQLMERCNVPLKLKLLYSCCINVNTVKFNYMYKILWKLKKLYVHIRTLNVCNVYLGKINGVISLVSGKLLNLFISLTFMY